MHRTIAIATVLGLAILAGRSVCADESAAEGLPNDWKRTEIIPAVDRPIALRAYRERKTAESPEWPVFELPESMQNGMGNAVRTKLRFTSRVLDFWNWIESGPVAGGPDVWVRLARSQIREIDPYAKGNRPGDRPRSDLSLVEFSSGTRITNDGAVGTWKGSRHLQDEGDLLLVSRASFDTLSRALRNRNLRENFGTDEPPALTAQAWMNGAEPVFLDQLKGKVVLLDFWSVRSPRSERQLSRAEELHKKYGPKGLIVIGVHPVEKLDVATTWSRTKRSPFP